MIYTPLDCQEEGYNFILEEHRSGLLFRMGIGKTITVLTAVEELIYNRADICRVLVVAPKRVALMTWPDEIMKWHHTQKLRFTVLHGKDKDLKLKLIAPNVDITLINYEGLRWLWNNRKVSPYYDMVVFDESTYLKNPTSGRSELARDISRKAKRVIIMTGTFKPNGLENLWNQMFMIDRGKALGINITSFRNEYMLPLDGGVRRKRLPQHGAKERALDKIKDKVLVVEDTTGVGLPDVVDNVIKLVLPDKVQDIYHKLESEWVAQVDEETITLKNMQSQIQKLRQLAIGFIYTDGGTKLVHEVKLETLKEIKEGLAGNLMVGIQFKYEVDMIRDYFGYNVPAIYSPTVTNQGTKWIRQWMDGNLDMLLAHPASMSHGLNLQGGGQDICWFGLTWDLEHFLQLIARLRRRGSEYDTIFNHILCMQDTVDELILRIVTAKNIDQEKAMRYLREWHLAKKKKLTR